VGPHASGVIQAAAISTEHSVRSPPWPPGPQHRQQSIEVWSWTAFPCLHQRSERGNRTTFDLTGGEEWRQAPNWSGPPTHPGVPRVHDSGPHVSALATQRGGAGRSTLSSDDLAYPDLGTSQLAAAAPLPTVQVIDEVGWHSS
jgi:hypothetical protein